MFCSLSFGCTSFFLFSHFFFLFKTTQFLLFFCFQTIHTETSSSSIVLYFVVIRGFQCCVFLHLHPTSAASHFEFFCFTNNLLNPHFLALKFRFVIFLFNNTKLNQTNKIQLLILNGKKRSIFFIAAAAFLLLFDFFELC